MLAQLLIYLTAAIITVPISKRLGLGSVLGFLIAGIIIGPSGFKLITDIKSIFEFSEFGIVLLLFLIGLELSPKRLWSLRRAIFGLGFLQVFISTAIISACTYFSGFNLTTALIIGMSFAMSSTAIALQLLTEKKLLTSSIGQSSFSILLFQDLMVIPIMIIISLLAHKNSQLIFEWPAFGKAIIVILGVIILGKYLLRPILRYIANTGLREIFIAGSLLLILSIALLMEKIGLSMAMGAFLAGVLLANSEYRYQLELDIEPFKGLLLGLFFIAVGMSIDANIFLQHALLIVSIALGLVALKTIILYTLTRNAYVFLLSQVGEFAFVIFNVAYGQQLLSNSQLDILNAMVAISMLTTPCLMFIYDRFKPQRKNQTADQIEKPCKIIIAGFGRVGGIIARLLHSKKINATIIDIDPDQIELVRRFGFRAYYGDITRLDLLKAAGADNAKLLILAIDDSDAILLTIKLVRQYFPHLKIIARAKNRMAAFELVEQNIPVFRETFLSSLAMGEAALIELGYSPEDTKDIIQQFKQHDENQLIEAAPHRHDQKKLITLAGQGRAELEKLLKSED